MATQIPVQTTSFRGIYTVVGGILVPSSLDWSFHLPDLTGIYFENTPNKTILLVRNRSLTETLRLTLFPVGVPVAEYPDYLTLADIGWIDLLAGQITIAGPFSTNIQDANNLIHYNTQGTIDLDDVDLAVVKFPE